MSSRRLACRLRCLCPLFRWWNGERTASEDCRPSYSNNFLVRPEFYAGPTGKLLPRYWWHALNLAVLFRHLDVIRYLLDNGVNVANSQLFFGNGTQPHKEVRGLTPAGRGSSRGICFPTYGVAPGPLFSANLSTVADLTCGVGHGRCWTKQQGT